MKKSHIERMRDRERLQDNALDTLEERMPEVSAQMEEFPEDMHYTMARNILEIMDTPEEQLNFLTLNIKALDTTHNIGKNYKSYINNLQDKAELAEDAADADTQIAYQGRADEVKSELKDSGFDLDTFDMMADSKNFIALQMAIEGADNYHGEVSPDLIERSYMLLDRFGVMDYCRAEGMSEGELFDIAEGYAKYATMKADLVQDVKGEMGLSKRGEINPALAELLEVTEISLSSLGIDDADDDLSITALQSNGISMSRDSGADTNDNQDRPLSAQPSMPRGPDL